MLYFIIILCILYLSFFGLATYGFYRKSSYKDSNTISSDIQFSIIIPARNEENNIIKCLESIKNQQNFIGNFEVIIVDDFSHDNTATLANSFFHKANLPGRVIKLSDHFSAEERLNSYKKKAIEIAIQEAKYEWIVQTDADCKVPYNWLEYLQKAASRNQAEFIVGPVIMEPPHFSQKEDLLYRFQAIDFMTMQGITAATHYYKIGLMCNGANMAYKKETFLQLGGFSGIDGIASGDDMLLLHKFYQKNPNGIFYYNASQSLVKTTTQETWNDFIQQRIRWSSKSDKYPDKRLTILLALVYVFNLTVALLFIYGLFHKDYLIMALYLLIFKILAELILVLPVSKHFKKTSLLWWFPFLQPLHIIYIISAGFLGKFGKYQWKNRTVK